MKNLMTLAACVCLAFTGMVASAQTNDHAPLNEPNHNRPGLFTNLPDRIEMSVETLQRLVASERGTLVSITSSTDRAIAPIEGAVVSRSKTTEPIQTVIVRSTNFNGANLTLSRFTDEEGLVQYSGRILSIHHGDAYVLQQEEGQYVLIRKKLTSLLQE